MMRLFLSWSFLFVALNACGTASKAKPYAVLNTEEKAHQALDQLEYELAITYFVELIEGDPENFERYRFLAAAYSALGGFDIIEAAKSNISGGAGESSSLLDSLGKFLPSNATAAEIEYMRLAKDTILAMPIDHRSLGHPEITYASGAAIQLQFYQSAYGVMFLNQFTKVGIDGKLDPDELSKMSDADVDQILSNFSAVAATGGAGVPAAAQAVIEQINQQEGASQRDKMLSYLNKSKGS